MKRFIALMAIAFVVLAGCGSKDNDSSAQDNGDTLTASSGGSGSDSDSSGGGSGDLKATSPESPVVDVVEVGSTIGPNSSGQLVGTAGAILENVGDVDAVFFEVIFNFKDAAGNPVATETDYVYFLEAGATGYAAIDYVELTGDGVTVEATAIMDEFSSYMDGASFPTTVTGLAPQEYVSGLEVSGTVTNSSSEVVDFATVTCVFLTAGEVSGGISGGVDTMPTGATQAWQISTFVGIDIAADTAQCAVDTSS